MSGSAQGFTEQAADVQRDLKADVETEGEKMRVVLPGERLAKAKFGFATRRVPRSQMNVLINGKISPCPGDLVLARTDRLGQHTRLEQPDGRKSSLFPGDEIVVCFADRYAPDQFEAEVGADLGPCHLVAAGGIAATALTWHQSLKRPTCIVPLGLIADHNGRRINVKDYALPGVTDVPRLQVVGIVGTAMNAGKTRAAGSLIRGLTAAGHRVAGIKMTGTGSGGDFWHMKDAGAHTVFDFTDAGFASTYKAPVAQLEAACRLLITQAAAHGSTIVVAELSDGLYQSETAALLRSLTFQDVFGGVFFAAHDAMGASAGSAWLGGLGYKILGLCGVLCRSPLAAREAEAATGMKCYGSAELSNPQILNQIVPTIMTAQILSTLKRRKTAHQDVA